MNSEVHELLRKKIHKVFLPGTPISRYALLAGRTDQVVRADSAILQPGRHLIIFGEKGVGKTSVAQVLVDIKATDGYTTLRGKTVNCDGSDDFSSLLHKVFEFFPLRTNLAIRQILMISLNLTPRVGQKSELVKVESCP